VQDTTTDNYVFLAMTLYGWGSGKTEREAIENCRSHNGSSHVKKYGYSLWRLHPDFEVSQIDGTVFTPEGHPAIKIADRIVKRKKISA